MSRIGKIPVIIPPLVSFQFEDSMVFVKGPKGALSRKFTELVTFKFENNKVVVDTKDDSSHAKTMKGTARMVVANMVKGVSDGFSTELELTGVGYKAAIQGKYLSLSINKSHPTKVEIPDDIKISSGKNGGIILESIDKERLGGMVNLIVSLSPPEPYKGKGIKIVGTFVQRKEGKKKG